MSGSWHETPESALGLYHPTEVREKVDGFHGRQFWIYCECCACAVTAAGPATVLPARQKPNGAWAAGWTGGLWSSREVAERVANAHTERFSLVMPDEGRT